jgi:Tol biopolymer transport system component
MKKMKQNPIVIVLTYLFCSSIFSSCATKSDEDQADIPYPLPHPDSVALPFLPGIVSTDSIDFGSAFSPDGKSFYFSRTENKQSEIYVTHHDGNNWTAPLQVVFNDAKYSEADPAFAPDGSLYFISNRPKDPSDSLLDYDIWFVKPLAEGRWSKPENVVSLNSDSSEFYISFSENGNLYFASSREGGFGEEDVFVSKWINGQYSVPENLGAAINSEKSEYDPCISRNEDLLVFTSPNREDTFGKGDLYGAKRSNNKDWSRAINLGKNFNTPTREFCPYITPDGKYFFFSSDGNIKWMASMFLKERLKVK